MRTPLGFTRLMQNRKRATALERHLRRHGRDKQAIRAWYRFYDAATVPNADRVSTP